MNYFEQSSERLIFRKLTAADIPVWLTFFENNDHLPFMGMDLSKDHASLAEGWITSQFDRYEKEGLGHLAVIEKSSGALVGLSGILIREIMDRTEYEIAYSLIPAYWRKGFGTEMAQQMKKFGMAAEVSDRFISIIHKDNVGSMKVAEKNGMNVFYKTHYLGMDVLVYGIEIEK